MLRIVLTLLSLFSVTCAAEITVIKAAGYVDVMSGKLISPAHIVVEDRLIKEVNPAKLPTDASVIDLGSHILMPGLMDMHTHLDLAFEGNFDYLIKESASTGTARAIMNARKTLLAGFTTVRSMGQGHLTLDLIDVAVADAARAGWILAPDIFAAGHMISITGGHADLTMGFAEGLLSVDPRHGIVNSVDEVTEAVRYQIKHGAKVIKIHATAGVLSPEASVGAQQLSSAEMRAAVEEAKRHDIKVAAHAHGTEGMLAAVKAGVDSIEHGSLVNDEIIALMKKQNVYLVPTTGLIKYVQPMLEKMPPILRGKAEYVLPLARASLENAIKSKVKIAIGSDAPVIPHGENAFELVALVERGMMPAEVLRSATVNGAELLGVTDRGQIKAGMLADIIAVETDPLKDISTVMSVPFVMKSGKVVKQ